MPARPPTKLTDKQLQTFAGEYALSENGTQSYLTVKPRVKETTASSESSKLLSSPKIQAMVRQARIDQHDQLMVKREEVLQEIASLAMFDPARMFGEDGRLLELQDMDPATRKMVNEMEMVMSQEGDRVLQVAKVKYGKDKRAYLDMLMKHFNAYEDHQKAASQDIAVYMTHPLDSQL